MDPKTLQLLMGSAGAGAVADKLYIEDVFSTFLYTGTGATQTITNGIDLSGKGGLVWFKNRTNAISSALIDTARGPNVGLASDTSGQNLSGFFPTFFTGFTSSGFGLGSAVGELNQNSNSYVSWTFRKAPKFFDVVTYTGTGTTRTVAHNLGSVPGCILIKKVTATSDWQVYHRGFGPTAAFKLNTTAAAALLINRWNNTTPTATQFTLGDAADGNSNGDTFIAYLFAHDAGGFGDSGNDNVISCGIYTGNGSTFGPTVTLGWEPQWLLVKRNDFEGDWNLIDNLRGFVVGGTDAELNPNLTNVESTGTFVTPTATGFRLNTTNTGYNAAGGDYIYIAIRRGPMKTPTDATKVFKALTRTGTGTTGFVTGVGFAPDTLINAEPTRLSVVANLFYDKLRSPLNYLDSASTAAESSGNSAPLLFTNDGLQLTTGNRANASSRLQLDYYFRRAPGFFDVVAYAGTGSASTVSHNLGVVPELMIIKSRTNGAQNWYVYAAPIWGTGIGGTSGFDGLRLNSNAAAGQNNAALNNTQPTSSAFSVGASSVANESGATFVNYLFATCPGVSKVGSYTGTGTTLNIDCGFTNGARFVLIKRTDSTGDWYIWDTARGIVSGNDSYLLLNSTAAEVTSTDYIDPLSSGFQISSTAPVAINASGGSYIYLSVA
jgi:hypothetical protein